MNEPNQLSIQSSFQLDPQNIPPLLDVPGIHKYIGPIGGRTTFYELASSGEIQTVSLGMGKRGKRLFVTSSIFDYIRRRAGMTQRPQMGQKGTKRAKVSLPEYAGYSTSSAGVAL